MREDCPACGQLVGLKDGRIMLHPTRESERRARSWDDLEICPGDGDAMRLSDVLTLREAAEHLGVRPDTLRQRIASGHLRGRKIGTQWVVTRDEVERYAYQSLGRRGRKSRRRFERMEERCVTPCHLPQSGPQVGGARQESR